MEPRTKADKTVARTISASAFALPPMVVLAKAKEWTTSNKDAGMAFRFPSPWWWWTPSLEQRQIGFRCYETTIDLFFVVLQEPAHAKDQLTHACMHDVMGMNFHFSSGKKSRESHSPFDPSFLCKRHRRNTADPQEFP
jgi:hypothetical protein